MKLQRKRLLALADHLERVKPERFSMGTWYHKRECGTIACAMGHACMMKRFQKRGLKLERVVSSQTSKFPRFKEEDGLNAAQRFFGLDTLQVQYLFGNSKERSPRIEADIIRDFVKDPIITWDMARW